MFSPARIILEDDSRTRVTYTHRNNQYTIMLRKSIKMRLESTNSKKETRRRKGKSGANKRPSLRAYFAFVVSIRKKTKQEHCGIRGEVGLLIQDFDIIHVIN